MFVGNSKHGSSDPRRPPCASIDNKSWICVFFGVVFAAWHWGFVLPQLTFWFCWNQHLQMRVTAEGTIVGDGARPFRRQWTVALFPAASCGMDGAAGEGEGGKSNVEADGADEGGRRHSGRPNPTVVRS